MHVASRTWPCSTCAYWQPYPKWEGVGTCDHTLSRYYARMAIGSAEPCEYYAESRGQGPVGRQDADSTHESEGRRRGGTTCIECHYWLPFELMPRVGQCDNPDSRLFRQPAFSDKRTEGCFVDRSLEGLEFMWCQTHHQTIYSAELPDHRGCDIFVSSVSLPVEDEMELTMAGD